MKQIKEKFEGFANSMMENVTEHEQEEKHVQKEVDTLRAEKTGIKSELSLKAKERQEIQTEINDLRNKIKQVFYI